jgi:hypothetical protein
MNEGPPQFSDSDDLTPEEERRIRVRLNELRGRHQVEARHWLQLHAEGRATSQDAVAMMARQGRELVDLMSAITGIALRDKPRGTTVQ